MIKSSKKFNAAFPIIFFAVKPTRVITINEMIKSNARGYFFPREHATRITCSNYEGFPEQDCPLGAVGALGEQDRPLQCFWE